MKIIWKSGGIGHINVYQNILVGDEVWDFYECYKRERLLKWNAGISEEYFNIDNIEINQGTIITRKMFGENNECKRHKY